MSANPYEAAGRKLVAKHRVTVRKWRRRNTGTAAPLSRQIEAPKPRGPISFAVLAHEVGHVVLHFSGRRYRWVEEVEAWEFALKQFDVYGLDGVERARADAVKGIAYAFAKAERRGASPSLIAETYPAWWDATRAKTTPADPANVSYSPERVALDSPEGGTT
jgi:hypothetical protein